MLDMTMPELMAILSFASKSAELQDDPPAMSNPVNYEQLASLRHSAMQVLARLDHDWPGMLPVPHDGLRWSERVPKPS